MKDHYKEMMEAGVMPGNLEKTDVEKLVEKFNQWADERIWDIRSTPRSSNVFYPDLIARVDALFWAKENLKRLAKEIKG